MPISPSIVDAQNAATEQRYQSTDKVDAPQRNTTTSPASKPGTSPHVACPCCNGDLVRIWRRPSDRIMSAFTPLNRYRCEDHDCQWEGNLRLPRGRHSTARIDSGTRHELPKSAVPVAFVVHMALAVGGALFVFLVAHIDW